MAGLTLDTGALIAYERADPRARGILARRDAVATSDPGDMRRLLGPACTILAV